MDYGEHEALSNRIDLSSVISQIEGETTYRGAHYEIVSKVAYLIGVPKNIFEKDNNSLLMDMYNKLDMDKRARIIHHLCRLRTQLEINFLKVCKGIQQEGRSMMSMPEYIPTDSLQRLSDDGVDIYKHLHEPSPFLFNINSIIKSRINNCRSIFPDWIDWKYLSDIFIMPGGTTEEGTKESASFYYENQSHYPYKQYINWPAADEDNGNILFNDAKFVTLLYSMNGDEFREMHLVSDVSDRTKSDIYKFIEKSEKTVFIVDCENSDPYALCAAIRNLDQSKLSRIEKIILYDDVHAASAWEMLAQYIDIPVEYIRIERLKDNKSLADIKVAARTCIEFYKNGAESFVLASSDSDYWGLIEELPEARFFVMIEHEKSSHALKQALLSHDIPFCYIDDFYTGGAEDIKEDAIKREFTRLLSDALELNLYSALDEVLEHTRIFMTESEKENYIKRHVRPSILMDIEDDNVRLRYAGK